MLIMCNLLSNSINFEFRCEMIVIRRVRKVEVKSTFEDNGIGIDTNKLNSQMFKPCKRFNTTPIGKGIGLHLIKTSIEKNNGKASAKSTPGHGACLM